MTRALTILQAGPAVTVQDMGRAGFLAMGVSPSGAADRLALIEGAALLGQTLGCAALELAGCGLSLTVQTPTRIALTGAPMRAVCDGATLAWNASYLIQPGATLQLSPGGQGLFGYLSVGGGIETPQIIGSRSAHLLARLGRAVQAGDVLPVGADSGTGVGQTLIPADRMSGGRIRVLPSAQTARFSPETRARFAATPFTRSPRGNRQAAELSYDGAPFASENSLSILSEPTMIGDIQMAGAGHPYVLMPECQTTGGYPRIGTVIPEDLPKVAQAGPGAVLEFEFITQPQAVALHKPPAQLLREARAACQPLIRDPHQIADLLGYQLIDGVTAGDC